MNLPIELINHILTYRPVHPLSRIIQEKCKEYLEEKEYRYSGYTLYHDHVHKRMSFNVWALVRWIDDDDVDTY